MKVLFTEHEFDIIVKTTMNRFARLYYRLNRQASVKVAVLAGLIMLAGSSLARPEHCELCSGDANNGDYLRVGFGNR